jgi:hypothetical protein
MDDLDRVYHRLLQNIRSRYPDFLSAPFTVAQLYEQIVPYRHYRRELGIDINQDYEIAIMRLLSGERGYIRADETMQNRLREELTSRNPDTGAFRDFGATQLWVNTEAAPAPRAEVSARATAASSASTANAPPADASSVTDAGSAQSATSLIPPIPSATDASRGSTAVPGTSSVEATTARHNCPYCNGILPEGRQITYCPHCGQNLAVMRCPACGSELDPAWKFCVTCGRKAG